MLKRLTTFEQVIDELGGVTAVARLTRRTAPAVCNWRKTRRRFPTTLYFVMQGALKVKGAQAERRLWGFVEPRKARASIPKRAAA
jgi:hypothetical protein